MAGETLRFGRGVGLNNPANQLLLAAPTYTTAGTGVRAVSLSDLNRDGSLDLIVASLCQASDNCTSGGIDILLGNGDDTFGPPASYSSGGSEATAVVAADLNHDGKIDLVVTNHTCGNGDNHGCVSVLLGNGDGTFQAATTYGTGGYFAASVAIADFNNDGRPDLVVANQEADSEEPSGGVSILLGNGNGTFQTAAAYSSAGYNASSLVTGDFNQDGKTDLAVTNLCVDSNSCLSGSVSILLGNGDGTLQAGVSFDSGGYDPNSMAIVTADFDRDGNADLAVAHECLNSDDCSTGSVSVLLGQGTGFFQPAMTYASGGSSLSLATGDFDGNGKTDLAVVDEQNDSAGTVSILFGNGDGTFLPPATYSSEGYFPTSIAAGDLTGDGKRSVVTTVQADINFGAAGLVTVLRGGTNGSFHADPEYLEDGPTALVTADFNHDNNPDLAVTRSCGEPCTGGVVDVQSGNGDGVFQAQHSYSTAGYYALDVKITDLDLDGNTDLVVANDCADQSCTSGSVGVLLSNGDGTFRPAVSFLAGSPGALSLAVGDFNGDGLPDVAVTTCNDQSCTQGSVSILLGNGNGAFRAPTLYPAGGAASAIATADLNGDGKLDLIVANPCRCISGDTVSILLGNGDGSFQPPLSYASGGIVPDKIQVGDLNHDGKLDLAIANQCHDDACAFGGVVGVLLGNGDGTFQPASSYSSWSGWSNSVQIGDFNGDGNPDISVINIGTDHATRSRSTVLLLGNGDGTFTSGDTYPIGGWDSTIGDFNNDGKPDLAVGDYSGFVILRNVATGFRFVTGVKLRASENPSDYGQPVIFTATIDADHAGSPTGTVTFYDGSTALGTAPISDKRARLSVVNLLPGTHAITAAYSGDHKFLGGTSAQMNEVIHKGNSQTNVTSSLNPSSYDQNVTFVAVVSYLGGTPPDGEPVTFKDGSNMLGTSGLQGGVARLTVSWLTAGPHVIKALYSGDPDLNSSSGKLNQTVNESRSISKLSSFLNPSQVGQKVKFRVRIIGEFGGVPTGTVTFKDGPKILGTESLNGEGLAYYVTSKLAEGEHHIHTSYSGDRNFSVSHALLMQTVQQPY